ncbi:MAG: trigger factor [Deltaproteobacteria bacterium]|nr:trigger factor [Deltaproteobacteria bacterium]
MKTTVEEISSVKKKILVEIEAKDVDQKIDSVFKKYAKKAKIKGFRPGKVPMKMVEKYYGDQVLEDAASDIVRETLAKAIHETEVYPLSMPVLENDEIIKKGQDYKYAAIIEVKPEFELTDYLGVKVEKDKLIVNDDDVENQVKAILKAHGKLTPLTEERGIQKEDYAVISYQGFEGDVAVDGMKAENYSLYIGGASFYPGFEDELIGLKKGDKKEFTTNFKDDYINPKLKGKTIRFTVEVTDIKSIELPALDDAFVKGLGLEFDTVDALRERIKTDLTSREEKRIESDLRNKIVTAISDKVTFDLPESLVENEIEASIENMKNNFMRSGASIEKLGLSYDRMKTEFRPIAERNIKASLILGKIASLEKFEVEEKELSDSFEEMAKESGHPSEELRKFYEANDYMEGLKQSLLKEKTLKYLVENASVTEVEPVKNAEKD